MLKKLIVLLLSLVVLFGFTSCSDPEPDLDDETIETPGDDDLETPDNDGTTDGEVTDPDDDGGTVIETPDADNVDTDDVDDEEDDETPTLAWEMAYEYLHDFSGTHLLNHVLSELELSSNSYDDGCTLGIDILNIESNIENEEDEANEEEEFTLSDLLYGLLQASSNETLTATINVELENFSIWNTKGNSASRDPMQASGDIELTVTLTRYDDESQTKFYIYVDRAEITNTMVTINDTSTKNDHIDLSTDTISIDFGTDIAITVDLSNLYIAMLGGDISECLTLDASNISYEYLAENLAGNITVSDGTDTYTVAIGDFLLASTLF